MEHYESSRWWTYMEEPMRDLVKESYEILEQESGRAGEPEKHDYSFVVFPMAKAYEGFLKKLFFDLGLINKRQYQGDRFRVGKSLNPNLPVRYQWDWVYNDLITRCKGEQIPQNLWEVWKKARNRIFHYFPGHHEFITLMVAGQLIAEISTAMEQALLGCEVQARLV